MIRIRVDPAELRRAALEIDEASQGFRGLGERALRATSDAPSYDGQFGPDVWGIGADAYARMSSRADRLSALSQELDRIAEAFAKADQQSLDGLAQLEQNFRDWLIEAGLLAPDGTIPQGSLLSFLSPGFLVAPSPTMDTDGEGEKPPWWGPLAQSVEGIRRWFDSSVGEPLRDMPMTWRGNLYNARIIALNAAAQGWFAYDQAVNQFIRDRVGTWQNNLAMLDVIWNEKVWAVQEPGLPADGPITSAMATISQTDLNGNAVSIVGSELAQLIDDRGGVAVHFSDLITGGTAGVAPTRGLVVLPNRYQSALVQAVPGNAGLVAHELAHVLQRDLPEFPDGFPPFGTGPMAGSWPFTPEGINPLSVEYGVPLLGDFTLYMEVQSNIVGMGIEYDLLGEELANLSPGSLRRGTIISRMDAIEVHLATYTGPAADAAAYVPQQYNGHEMYVGEMVKEVIFGARIPDGGWEHWLAQQGFSDKAIERIQQIASKGVPEPVALSGMLDGPGTAAVAPSTPSATPTPTATPTVTPTSSPTPTPSPTPSPTPTPEPPTPTSTTELPD